MEWSCQGFYFLFKQQDHPWTYGIGYYRGCYNLPVIPYWCDMDIIERFAGTLDPGETEILDHLRAFIEWFVRGDLDFVPSGNDDVALRTYLLQLKTNGVSEKSQRAQISSLRRFYKWGQSVGLVEVDPFLEFSVERPSLTREQIRRRKEIFSGSPEEREIARLRTLNQLAGELNRSSDVHTTLTAALEMLVSLMNLQSGWAFLLPTTDGASISEGITNSDKFTLGAVCGLPPGLEKNNRYHLTEPALCHCQALMRDGQLKRAVNVVECTRLNNSAEDQGDNEGLLFHATVPILASNRPIGIINVATREWQFLTSTDLQLLSAVGSQVAVALERARLYDVTYTQRLRLERELQLAREVQQSLLPDQLPEIGGFSLAADWRSALEMAGDFYDLFQLPDGRWGIVVADVSDKGAPAAMYMAMTRSLIRAGATYNPSPAGVLMEVNQRLLARSSSDMFVTAFYAVLDPASYKLVYANAGQNPPLLRRHQSHLEPLTRTGIALGVIEEMKFTEVTVKFAPGDALFIYTDGITDALNSLGEDYGLDRFNSAVMTAPASGAEAQLTHLLHDFFAFAGEVPPFDDTTLLIIARQTG